MIPPSRTPVWEAIETVADLDVRPVQRDGVDRVLLIDKRTWTELACLSPADAELFADRLLDAADETPYRLVVGEFLSGPT